MRSITLTLVTCVITAGSVVAGSVVARSPQFYEQPYTKPLDSFESRVKSCTNPVPLNLAACDDFSIGQVGDIVTINTVVWWGNLFTAAQFGRPYYIAIYKDNGNCLPALGSLVFKDCIKPEEELETADCHGRRVFRFKAPLNTPMVLDGGARYWIQISESDEDSAQPGIEDFRWSAHRPIVKCPAAQFDAWGFFTQPLIDTCDWRKDDLAFALYN